MGDSLLVSDEMVLLVGEIRSSQLSVLVVTDDVAGAGDRPAWLSPLSCWIGVFKTLPALALPFLV